MGTWGSDALYNALSHAATPRHDETLITKRWKEWEPAMALVALNATRAREFMARTRIEHSIRLTELLDAGISMTAIRRKSLDYPLLSNSQFKQALIEAKERRMRSPKLKGKHAHSK